MAICKQFVEMMGGTIGVESREGQGSTFSCTAIFGLSPTGRQLRARHRPHGRSNALVGTTIRGRTARVLVAEDNTTNREVVLAQLQKLGYDASAVTNGVEAVEAVERGGFDLVLMDCQMPVMDGFEATRCIRSSAHPRIPIIAVTADAMSDDRDRCLSEGMNDYLAKPVELGPLRDVLATWLAESASGDMPQKPVRPVDQQTKTAFNEDALLARLMGDRHLAGVAVRGFLEGVPSQLDNLRRRLEEADAAGARLQAQELQGSAALVSAEGLCAMALAMERAGNAGELDHCSRLLPRVVEEFERCKSILELAGWVRT